MKPKQLAATACVVIGPTDLTGQVMSALNEKGVKTRCFPSSIPPQKIGGACADEKRIKLIAIFTRGLPDFGISLIRGCKDAFGGAPIQIFQEGEKQKRETALLKDFGVQFVHSELAVSVSTAMNILRKRCEGDESLPDITTPYRHRVKLDAGIETLLADIADSGGVDDAEDIRAEKRDEKPAVLKDTAGTPIHRFPTREERKLKASEPKREPPPLPAKQGEVKQKAPRKVQKPPKKVSVPRHLRKHPHLPNDLAEPVKDWRPILKRVKQAMANARYVIIDPVQALPMPGQPRVYFHEASLKELADSIAEIGQFVPGIIRRVPRKGGVEYQVLDGERRWRAVMYAKVNVYKAMLVEIDDEAAPFVIASIANFNREGHTHLEISDAIERLHVGLGMPMPEVAKMYGIVVGWAYQLHQLQKLHPLIRNLLDPNLKRRERLGLIAAIAISKGDLTVQEEALKKYQRGEVTLKGLRRYMLDVSEKTGTYIRRRRKEPARILESALRQAGAISRMGKDLGDFLREGDNLKMLTQSEGGVEKIIATLQGATEALAICRTFIK